MFHHVGIIHLVHGGHAAAGVPAGEIFLQQGELFFGGPGAAFADDQVIIARSASAGWQRRGTRLRDYPHRYAGLAIDAGRAIGNGLAAAEPDPAERIVQLFGMGALQFGEHLAFRPARQIGARRRARHEEPGKANRCRHGWLFLLGLKRFDPVRT
jgi:hypothetical protein